MSPRRSPSSAWPSTATATRTSSPAASSGSVALAAHARARAGRRAPGRALEQHRPGAPHLDARRARRHPARRASPSCLSPTSRRRRSRSPTASPSCATGPSSRRVCRRRSTTRPRRAGPPSSSGRQRAARAARGRAGGDPRRPLPGAQRRRPRRRRGARPARAAGAEPGPGGRGRGRRPRVPRPRHLLPRAAGRRTTVCSQRPSNESIPLGARVALRPHASAVSPSSTSARAPVLLVAATVVVVALVCLPLVYLVVRVVEGGADAWVVLGRARVLELVGNTVLLVVLVTGAALALGAAGVARHANRPARSPLWAVAAALPLVIPSYVAALALLAAFGPRGFLQQVLEGPFGIERVPEIYGLPGAVLALTISTCNVYLLAAAALRDLDPALEEASRSLGRSRAETFRRVTPGPAPVARRRGASRCALHTVGLRRSLAHAVQLAHAGDLRPVPLALRPDAGRRARPGPRRADGDRAPARVLRARASSTTAARRARRVRRSASGSLAGAGPPWPSAAASSALRSSSRSR